MATKLLLILSLANTAYSSPKARAEEFSRITEYELIRIPLKSVDDDTKMIEFDAFNQHYSVRLTVNNDMVPINIRHTNIDPTSHKHQYFSSMTESCHYHGRVLNTYKSLVSVSLCHKRGIRGRITAFNDTLIIYPSAYYLDLEKDKKCDYKLTDELIVYRLSDFNSNQFQHNDLIQLPSNSKQQDIPHKRRLYSSSNPAYVEMLLISGPVRTRNYKADYEEQWYQQILADLTQMINSVSAIYKDTNWGSSVGGQNSISVVFKELEIIESFDGIYKSLKPDKLYTNCELSDDEYDDTDLCAIDGQNWLGTIQNWIYNNKDVSTFDHAQLISDMPFKWSKRGLSTSRTLGWGNVGALCRGSASVSDVSVIPDMGGNTAAIQTMAHELGHSFSMEHDGQSGAGADCDEDAGLMGYGDGNGFSRCSIASMQLYFTQSDGLTCIGNGWNHIRTQNRFDNASIGTIITTSSTSQSPTVASSSTSSTQQVTTSGCVRIDGLDDYLYNGAWMQLQDTYYDKAAYSFTNSYSETSYLYFRDDLSLNGASASDSWYIGRSLGSLSIGVYCAQTELVSCSGKFTQYTENGWNVINSSTVDIDCSTTSTTTTSTTSSTVAVSTVSTSSTSSTSTTSTTTSTTIAASNPMNASDCVHIDGISEYFYNGDWQQSTELYNNKNTYYFKNSYNGDTSYLYFRDDLSFSGTNAVDSWYIGSIIGSMRISAYCAQTDLFLCSGQFRSAANGWNVVNSSIINSECSDTASCSSYTCLFTAGIRKYNGRWQPAGCINDEAYYQLDDDDKYICYSNIYKQWIITDVLCSVDNDDLHAMTLQQTEDILESGGWFISDVSRSGSFTQRFGATINECSANNALNVDDLSCLNSNDYEDDLCIESNNSMLWNGENTFERSTFCHNDEAVYLYIVYNESIAGDNEARSVQSVYYLFFHPQLKYSDSNETVAQWLITKDAISVNSLALCEQDDLLDCTANEWKVQTTQLLDDNVYLDGLVLRITDPFMTVNNGKCEDMEQDNVFRNIVFIAVCIVTVCVLIAIGFGICAIITKNNKIEQSLGEHARVVKQQIQSADGEEDIVLEVSLERDVNDTVPHIMINV